MRSRFSEDCWTAGSSSVKFRLYTPSGLLLQEKEVKKRLNSSLRYGFSVPAKLSSKFVPQAPFPVACVRQSNSYFRRKCICTSQLTESSSCRSLRGFSRVIARISPEPVSESLT